MSLKGFYKENVKRDVKLHEVVISDAFRDENGKPIAWKLKALKQTKVMDISNKHLKLIMNTEDKTSITEGSTSDYSLELIAKTVVYPNLNDAELQNSYGVMTAEALIDAMFEDDNEGFNKLLKEVNKINGTFKTPDKMVKEVKN